MKRKFLSLLLSIPLFMGCANKKDVVQDENGMKAEGKSDIPLVMYRLNSTISPQLKQTSSLRVAVLPPTLSPEAEQTTQKWNDVDAPKLFRTVFFGRFGILPYKDVPIREVDHLLSQNGIAVSSLEQVSTQKLGELLGVDALIYLHLTEIENVTAGVHGRTEYAATLIMKETSSNQELWRAQLKQNIFGGLLSGKSSQVGEFIEFEKLNRNRPLAFRKVAEVWSHKVIEDLREKTNATE